jgi:carboxymethylenebutenolidase
MYHFYHQLRPNKKDKVMKELNPDQNYFIEEFYEDFREGFMSRREFIKRVAYITGSMAATAATMGLIGCSPEEIPDPTAPMPTPTPPMPQAEGQTEPAAPESEAELVPVPGAQSPFSVPEGDPAVSAETVTFASQGDNITAYLAQPAEAAPGSAPYPAPYPAVLICHENRGLTDHIRDVARRFAKAGYVALAIDLLSREGGTATQDESQVSGLLSNAPAGRHVADFIAGYAYLESLDPFSDARIGMTGYCFGGGITWDVATALPELKAAVPYYGRNPDLSQVSNIQAAVLGVYAENDSRINAGLESLEEALAAADVTYQIYIYPGVDHAFHNDTGSRYVEEPATQAWQDTLAWFDQHL